MKDTLDAVTAEIIGGSVDVHRALGPGLLESAYSACLSYELAARGLSFERQKPLPITYRGVAIDCAYRMDFVVEGAVIVEVKSVDRLMNLHDAQLLSYLRLYDRRVGLLFNFNVKWLVQDGLKRLVNNFPDAGAMRNATERHGRSSTRDTPGELLPARSRDPFEP